MIGTCFALWMSGAAALADDAWGRPEHLRVVPVLTSQWSMRSRAQPLRVWWDGDQLGDVEVVYGSRWVRVGRGVASGFTTPPLPRDAQLRVRLEGADRSSPVVAPLAVDDPVATGRLGGWGGGADVVGQVVHDDRTGDVWASSVGGGLLWRPAADQPLHGGSGEAVAGQWRVLGMAEGLPDTRVLAVAARNGRVLVGTAAGLAVVEDGQVVEVVDAELPDSYVQAVHIADESDWWVGTYQGLARGSTGGGFEAILTPWSVFSLAPARGGGVWAGYEGLRRVTADGKVEPWLDGLEELHVYGLVDTAEGLVAATTEHGLVLAEAPDQAAGISPVVDRDAYGVAVGPGGLWSAAGQLGLVDPEGGMWGRSAGLPADGVRSVHTMPDGSLYVGTDAGLARVVPRSSGPPLIDVPERGAWPARMSVAWLVADVGGMWVAGEQGLRVVGDPHPDARDLMVAMGAKVSAVTPAPDGSVWAVGDRLVSLDARGGLTSWWLPATADVLAWQPGAGLFVGGTDGLWRLDVERDRFVPVAAFREVDALSAGDRGLWVASAGKVFRVLGGAIQPHLQTSAAMCVSASRDGAWVGTRSGLERIRLGGEESDVDDVLGDADLGVAVPVVSATEAGVWFAAEDGSIGRIEGERWGMVALPGPDTPVVTALAPDGDHAWVGTDAGVFRVFLPASRLTEDLPAAVPTD